MASCYRQAKERELCPGVVLKRPGLSRLRRVTARLSLAIKDYEEICGALFRHWVSEGPVGVDRFKLAAELWAEHLLRRWIDRFDFEVKATAIQP